MGFPRLPRRRRARRYPSFRLRCRPRSPSCSRRAAHRRRARQRPDGPLEVTRRSRDRRRRAAFVVRERAGLQVDRTSARRWTCCGCGCRAARRSANDSGPHRSPAACCGDARSRRLLAMRVRHRQGRVRRGCARAGLDGFRREVGGIVAVRWATASHELRDWDDVKLLTVAVNRLQRWCRPGLLCIGDAAHAMSPIGGVGRSNLAVQDAVAAANLAGRAAASAGALEDADLAPRCSAVGNWPTRVTQRMQIGPESVIAPAPRRNDKGDAAATGGLPRRRTSPAVGPPRRRRIPRARRPPGARPLRPPPRARARGGRRLGEHAAILDGGTRDAKRSIFSQRSRGQHSRSARRQVDLEEPHVPRTT